MGEKNTFTGGLGGAVLVLLATSAAAETPAYIAGLRPDERPATAPVIEKFEQTPQWRAAALRGIGQPRSGVKFLDDQGAWYTPFNRPSLLGRYDIRGLHGQVEARKD